MTTQTVLTNQTGKNPIKLEPSLFAGAKNPIALAAGLASILEVKAMKLLLKEEKLEREFEESFLEALLNLKPKDKKKLPENMIDDIEKALKEESEKIINELELKSNQGTGKEAHSSSHSAKGESVGGSSK